METFFTNSWTIGIGGGIVSGLIVFLVTSKIFSRRENKEYLQKVRIANNELLYAIRPLVVEQKLPTLEIINSILVSTAKKYNVQIADLYKRIDIADDLTKEIMDNPFLNSESKLQYCKLTEDIKQLGIEPAKTEEQPKKLIYLERERLISKEFFSLTLGLISGLTVVITVVFVSKEGLFSEIKAEKFDTLRIIALLTSIPIIALAALKSLEILKNRELRKRLRRRINDLEIKDDITKDNDE